MTLRKPIGTSVRGGTGERLTPEEFAGRFGMSDSDLAATVAWAIASTLLDAPGLHLPQV